MKLVKYTLCDIELAMVDIDGVLYCSTPQLEKLFMVTRAQLGDLSNRWRKGEFTDVRFGDLKYVNHVLKEVADSLELVRARKSTRLWSEDDVLGFCFHLRSDIARKCRAQFKEILKQHARRDYIPANCVDELVASVRAEVQADMQAQLQPLQDAVNELMADRKKMASYAGRSLRLVRNA